MVSFCGRLTREGKERRQFPGGGILKCGRRLDGRGEGGNRGNRGVYGTAVVLGGMAHMYRYLKAVRGGDSS